MRAEKKYLVEEVVGHLGKSSYVFLADYNRLTVPDFKELRESLAKLGAEFHVVKNSILKYAGQERNLPEFDEALEGQTAIVVGGDTPSEVAKILIKFHKDKEEKGAIKLGILDEKKMSAEEVKELSKLPSLEILRGQLLGLLNTPAQQMVRVLQAVPEGMLNVLDAKSKKG